MNEINDPELEQLINGAEEEEDDEIPQLKHLETAGQKIHFLEVENLKLGKNDASMQATLKGNQSEATFVQTFNKMTQRNRVSGLNSARVGRGMNIRGLGSGYLSPQSGQGD